MTVPSEPEPHGGASSTGTRRSPMDVVRDTAWRIATAALTGPSPEPRVRAARVRRERSAAGRFVLFLGVPAAVAATALLVVLVVVRPYQRSVRPEEAAGLPGRPPPAPASPSASATTAPAAGSRTPRPPSPPAQAADIAGSPSPSVTTSEVPAPLTATLTTTPYVVGLLGYRTDVTVTNPGPDTRQDWTLTVTLPRSTLVINQVEGATVTQQGAVWTFVPGPATTIPAGQQATVSFDVHGATLIDAAPADCRIDGAPCT